jgi:predicted Ser/Thr protein kinase
MKDNLLEGHSGCKLFLIKTKDSDRIECVRKLSKDKEYNFRLKAQALKQAEFKSKVFLSPNVFSEGKINNIYFFDMQYIRGRTMSSSIVNLNSGEIELIADNVVSYIQENRLSSKETNITDKDKLVIKKLSDIKKSLNSRGKKKLNSTFKYLDSFDWSTIESSPCHGDLTFENILISDEKIYLIDFLDTFIETWVSDVSKMLQDLIVGWSFRKKIITNEITELEKIKMHLFKDVFCRKINNKIDKTDLWEQVHVYLLLDLLRIIPYTNDKNIYEYIERSILKLTNEVEKGKFYEYINNSMRWPL